ncbi:glycosyltransferase [Pseudoclavibacter sp. RFBA6]|uniref:glycosyltransferase n=1 Tax=Pseudoclavibacter sp. RFBA6 TaxID=2080573 RepID=UPI0015E1CD54|nr:glycosyltransferase [Pseudoclavibacter sp. RFBA6]
MAKNTLRNVALKATRKAAYLAKAGLGRGGEAFGRLEARAGERLDGAATATITPSQLVATKFHAFRPLHAAPPAGGQRPAVSVFGFFNSSGFFGGIATLITLSAVIAQELDLDLRLVHTASFEGEGDVVGFLRGQGIDFDASRIHHLDLTSRRAEGAEVPLHDEDVLVASAWWDAFAIQRMAAPHPFIYLIQDYEPIFYANGDMQLWAASTYDADGFIPVLNTSILHDFFRESRHTRVAEEALVFEPAVSVLPRTAPVATRRKKRLFFYARPSVERNLFYAGLLAIDEAFTRNPQLADDWEVWLAGNAAIPPLRLESGVTLQRLGKMSLPAYQEFMLTADLAISAMLAPHPNYPTLEFSHLGIPVITTAWETKQDLGRYSPLIHVTAPTIEAMAAKISELALADGPSPVAERDSSLTASWPQALHAVASEVAAKRKASRA